MATVIKCPICKQAMNYQYRPFCSKRCADVDLARWLRGDYRIETDEKPDQLPQEDKD